MRMHGSKVADGDLPLEALPGFTSAPTDVLERGRTFHTGETRSSIGGGGDGSETGPAGGLPGRITFDNDEEEALYQRYLRKIRRDVLAVFLLLSMLFNLYGMCMSIVQFDRGKLPALIVLAIAIVINVALFALLKKRVFPEPFFKYFPYILWCWLGLQILLEMELNREVVSPRESLGFVMLFLYSTYIMLPVQWLACAVLSVLGAALHVLMVTLIPVLRGHSDNFPMMKMIGANLFMYIGTCLLGVVGYFAIDKAIRKSFLQTKASLSIHIEMEDRSSEQERLLNSVLPKYVAAEMIKDMGNQSGTTQFRKIYMTRHENVSILFADIVGFTALSSRLSGSELVVILNDLFATFDQLAQKYHHLRIKILGDCYYCICGCPNPRRDHAVLAIHMGLAMVEAISAVREKTRSGVNMRVGIHTGAVLGGVLGQIRWQFDVLGKEVTLANKMESGGIPGRVHISQVTKQCLNNEFELEPGDGEKREESLRLAGIKTFLVKTVLKQYPRGTLDHQTVNELTRSEKTVDDDVNSDSVAENDANQRLYEALMEREEKTQMWKTLNPCSLHFKESEIEKQYLQEVPRFGGAAILCLSLALLMIFCSQLTLQQIDIYGIIILAIGFSLLLAMGGITLSGMFRKLYPRRVVELADYIEGPWWLRTLWAVTAVIIIAVSTASSMASCVYGLEPFDENNTITDTLCAYPIYFTDFGVLIIIGITLTVQFDYLWKSTFILVITVFYVVVHFVMLHTALEKYDLTFIAPHSDAFVSSQVLQTSTIIAISISMIYLSRHLDYLSRKLFFYNFEVKTLQTQISKLREKNTQLIYNILPAHVAGEFVGQKKHYNELYSLEHDSVGVMFAACPNFNDFYTEDAVNNNGLECIRLLNEILSDYDDLLKDQRFSSIVKIKTIGPTVMCASGMNETNITKDSTVTERWQHLADLVEFALAMKETLGRINSQSFNNFMLRIGIHQGPVLAGVIGVTKPHYDIWGNTVNVASRMETTGQLGKLQVVEDSVGILTRFGYTFEPRGRVRVKGKGELMTYFLTGRISTADKVDTINII